MEFIDITFTILLILFFTGLAAGFVDSIAGGGGLIALPMLMICGLPATLAIGTNKLQGTFGTFSATVNFIQKGQIRLKDVWFGIILTAVGAFIGAKLVMVIDGEAMEKIIPILLTGIFLYALFSKNKADEGRKPLISGLVYFVPAGLAIGFYDGFFGPGTGSIWTASLMFFLGKPMVQATGITKVMNLTSNLVALIFFITQGNFVLIIGVTMGVAQLIGARIGSSMAISKGASFIRPVFLTVVFLTMARVFYSSYIA